MGRSRNTESRLSSRIPIDSYEALTRHLEDREYFGQDLGLERIQAVLARLGHPDRKFPSIHIAGTNGKGSTAAMLASILTEAGHRVGLFTSPHLEDFCERVQVSGILISHDEVLHHARRVRDVEDEPLTFFELATAIAFLHFAEEKIDIAIIETGLGGRLDATNVVMPLVSVITSIGLDHTAVLGETIEKIAFEKGGIIKPGVPVVVGEMPPKAMKVIRELALVKGARLVKIGGEKKIEVNLAGDHQRQNAAVAVAVIGEFKRQGWFVSDDAVRKGLENVRWPGRLETILKKPWILLDGAHNPDAMRTVREYLEGHLNGRRLKVLFGAMADKDIKGMLSELLPLRPRFTFTAPGLKRAARPEEIARIAETLGAEFQTCSTISKSLEYLQQDLLPSEVLLVTGSFFVVGDARAWYARNRS